MNVDIKCVDKYGRTIRAIVSASENEKLTFWAKTYGTYLDRYHITCGKGLNSGPVNESKTCVIYYATDMEKAFDNPKRDNAIKLMFSKDNFDCELKA